MGANDTAAARGQERRATDTTAIVGQERLAVPEKSDQGKDATADQFKEAERGQQWESTASVPPIFDKVEPQTPAPSQAQSKPDK
jgi:hypothetical protein